MEKLLKFLKGNILIILLAFVPPIAIWFFFQRDIKDIEISLVSNIPVVSIEKQFSKGIKVQFEDKEISSLRVIDVKIRNAGNRPIERADFDEPLTLHFDGKIIPPVDIVASDPPNLPASIGTGEHEISIKPMLLNSGDSFILRTKVADASAGGVPVKPISRIKGVKKIVLSEAVTDKYFYKSFALGVFSSIIASISFFALTKLLSRARRLVVSLPGGIELEISQLEKRSDTSHRASELAELLQISKHDFKSNLLLLRLKIEEQLRQLARLADFGPREQVGSFIKISRLLEEKGVIDHAAASLIRDIAPVINRELHESDSYLTEAEYNELQRAALSLVAALEGASTRYYKNSALLYKDVITCPECGEKVTIDKSETDFGGHYSASCKKCGWHDQASHKIM